MKIFVDLDGTFFKIDTTKYLLQHASIKNKFIFLKNILLNKRAQAKFILSQQYHIKTTNLQNMIRNDINLFCKNEKSYDKFSIINPVVLEKLCKIRKTMTKFIHKTQKNNQNAIILATGTNKNMANYIINTINENMKKHHKDILFDQCIGSTKNINAVGLTKLLLLKNFIRNAKNTLERKNIQKIEENIYYFGNSLQDIPVWLESKKSFIVTQNKSVQLIIRIILFMKNKKIEIVK